MRGWLETCAAGLLALVGCAVDAKMSAGSDAPAEVAGSWAALQRAQSGNELSCGLGCCAVVHAQRELVCWGPSIARVDERDVAHGSRACSPVPRELQQIVGGAHLQCSPVPIAMGLDSIAQVVLSGHGACTLSQEGNVRCWKNERRQFCPHGPPAEPRPYIGAPYEIAGLRRALHLGPCENAGWYGSMAGGRAEYGRCLGIPDFVTTVDSMFRTCILRADGSVWCWGSHLRGQLGVGPSAAGLDCRSGDCTRAHSEERAVRVPGIEDAVALSGDEHRTCATLGDGTVWCWGAWEAARYDQTPWSSPQRIEGLEHVTTTAMAARSLCALDVFGVVRCLGRNGDGQLGDGTRRDRDRPVRALLPRRAIAIDGGYSHFCAVLDDRSLWCWGTNSDGELGDGTLAQRAAPVQTLPPGSVSEPLAGLRVDPW